MFDKIFDFYRGKYDYKIDITNIDCFQCNAEDYAKCYQRGRLVTCPDRDDGTDQELVMETKKIIKIKQKLPNFKTKKNITKFRKKFQKNLE